MTNIQALPDNPAEAILALGPMVRELKSLAMKSIVQDRPDCLFEDIKVPGVANLTRAFYWATGYYSVSCVFNEGHRWHISIVRVIGPGEFQKAENDVCEIITKAFFGEGHREIPCEGKMIRCIRHFVKEAE